MKIPKMYKKNFALLFLLCFLTACGMRPLYSENSTDKISCHSKALHISEISNRKGYVLRTDLQNKFHANTDKDSASYILNIKLKSSQKGLGIEEDDSTSLSKLTLIAYYQLLTKKGVVLKKGIVRSVNNFNILESPYASLMTEQDAEKRSLKQISYQIHQRLSVFFKKHKNINLNCKTAD